MDRTILDQIPHGINAVAYTSPPTPPLPCSRFMPVYRQNFYSQKNSQKNGLKYSNNEIKLGEIKIAFPQKNTRGGDATN